MLQLLAKAGHGEPLLILIDEAHRLSEGAMALMRAVLDRPWDRSVIVVVAGRSDATWHSGDGEQLLDLLKREETITMEVARLRTADLSDLVDRLDLVVPSLEPIESPPDWASRPEGSHSWFGEVLTIWKADVDVVTSATEAKGGSLTPLIQAVIGQRLDGLSTATRRLLETAAVVGMQFDVDVIAPACGLSALEMLELLDEALGAGIIVETGQFDCFAFDHGLIRGVLASRVSTSRRVRIHGAAAQALDARGASIDSALHAIPAIAELGLARTVELTLRGADAALASLQFELARFVCDEVLNAATASLPSGLRVDLLIRVGQAQVLAGHAEAAEEAWSTAATIARSIGDHERLALVALATDLLSRNVDASDLRWALLTEAMEQAGPGWTRLTTVGGQPMAERGDDPCPPRGDPGARDRDRRGRPPARRSIGPGGGLRRSPRLEQVRPRPAATGMVSRVPSARPGARPG